MWIWRGGKGLRWHNVFMTSDSVTGIPYDVSVRCEECRLSIPLTEVDSVVDMRRGKTQYVVDAALFVAIAGWAAFGPGH